MSRHQNHVAKASRPNQVATSKRGRDTKTRPRPSWRLTYVVTSISCRDLVLAHNGISKSRHQNPGRDLPHCHPCRDLKNDVVTLNPTGQITTSNSQVATPKSHPTSRPRIHVATPFPPNQNKRGRDLKMRWQHQIHSVLLRRQNPRSPSLRPTATGPGRDATSWS